MDTKWRCRNSLRDREVQESEWVFIVHSLPFFAKNKRPSEFPQDRLLESRRLRNGQRRLKAGAARLLLLNPPNGGRFL